MGCASSKEALGGGWHGASDSLNEGDKKYVESKISENECFLEYQINIDEMLGHMDRGNLNLNQYLFKKGNKSDALYVIMRGTCDIFQGDKKIGIYNKGSIIGDTGLKNNVSRTFTVRCSSAQCDLLRLTKMNYEKLIAEYKHRKESRNFKTLFNAGFLQGIPPEIIRRIESTCDEKTFHEGNVIVKKDFKSKNAYIIKSGSVREENFNGIADTSKHNQFYCFGEECILNDELCCYYSSTIVASEYTTCLVLDAPKLKDLITESLLWHIQDNITNKLKALKRLRTDPDFILNPIIKTVDDAPADGKGFLTNLMRASSSRPQSFARTFSIKDLPLVEEPKVVPLVEETKEEPMKMIPADDASSWQNTLPKSVVSDVMSPESWVICNFLDFNQAAAAPKTADGEKKKKKKKKVVAKAEA